MGKFLDSYSERKEFFEGINDKKLVQKEKERLDRLNEEKEYYVF